ncbi:hypothetical protein PanWU01x14_075480, partial [Parasponia andersonii]
RVSESEWVVHQAQPLSLLLKRPATPERDSSSLKHRTAAWVTLLHTVGKNLDLWIGPSASSRL